MKSLFLVIFFLISSFLIAQSPLRYELENSKWGYTVITPPGKAKGLIVFLPGFSQNLNIPTNASIKR